MAYEAITNTGGVGTTTQVVVGLFKNASDAHQAVTQLRAAGFSSSQIGAAFRGGALDSHTHRGDLRTASPEKLGHEHENWWDKVKDAFRSDDRVGEREEARETATESTYQSGNYATAEHEYDFADDDFQGSLAGTGVPADRAAHLTRSLESGGAIVTVGDANRAAEAEEILSANHARVRYEEAAGAAVTADNTVDAPREQVVESAYADQRPPLDADVPNGDRVQLFGEVLRVHKERINRGEVRVRKDVVTESQTIEVPVTREELVLERVAVAPNTPASSANIGREQEIRVPLSEDTVRVEKQPVLREEVIVGKREVADVATVGGDVRHEELRIDSDVASDLDTPKRAAVGEDLPGETRRHG